MTEPTTEFHHLEAPSVYDEPHREYQRERRGTIPSLPGDGISTPKYEVPNGSKNVSQVMLGIITPHCYDGESNPKEWLAYFENVSEANNWNEDFKFKRLISCLKGSPLIWYQAEKLTNPTFNYPQFKKGLTEKFSNECDNFLSQINIMRRKQKPNETFNNYWYSKLSLMELTAPKMNPEEMIIHLFNGLRDGLYEKVLSKFIKKKPQTLEKMYNIIKAEDDAQTFTRSRLTNAYEKERPKPREDYKKTEGSQDWNRNRQEWSRNRQDWNRNRQEWDRNRPVRRDNQLSKTLEELQNRLTNIELGANSKNNDNRRKTVTFSDEQEIEGNQTQKTYEPRRMPFRPRPTTGRPEENLIRRNDGPPNQYRGPKDLNSIQCWTCGEFGHYSFNCPLKTGDNIQAKNARSQN